MLRVKSSRMSNMIWPWQSVGAHQQPRDLADKNCVFVKVGSHLQVSDLGIV
jgi:hypothetical protein